MSREGGTLSATGIEGLGAGIIPRARAFTGARITTVAIGVSVAQEMTFWNEGVPVVNTHALDSTQSIPPIWSAPPALGVKGF